MLSELEWKEKGMDKYGLIALSKNGTAAQVEKVDHATATNLLSKLGEIDSVGASLGSFSISNEMLDELLYEFSSELVSKVGKFDSDPHLWMPMTLEKAAYLKLMEQKGITAVVASSHHDRIATMMSRFHSKNDSNSSNATGTIDTKLGVFGPVDVGSDVYWWDYGQLKLYQSNCLKMVDTTAEAALIRLFYGINDSVIDSSVGATTIVDSCVSSSVITSGSIKSSAVSNVRCNTINADGAILINVTAKSISAAPNSILYNIIDTSDEGIVLKEGDVMSGVWSVDGSMEVLQSHMDIDGGKAWDNIVLSNKHSFAQIHGLNEQTDPLGLSLIMENRFSLEFVNVTK